jgi:hypothetical protein
VSSADRALIVVPVLAPAVAVSLVVVPAAGPVVVPAAGPVVVLVVVMVVIPAARMVVRTVVLVVAGIDLASDRDGVAEADGGAEACSRHVVTYIN